MPRLKKIVWAIDAFESPGRMRDNAVEILKFLQANSDATIEPVCVLSEQLNYAVEFSTVWLPQYRASAEEALDQMLSAMKIPGLQPHRILVHQASSVTHVVDTFLAYAERAEADLIVANTHGRGGVKRFLLGSFAETLLVRSKIPTLIVGQHIDTLKRFDTILYPTDFGIHANLGFRNAVGLAKLLGSRIVLHHAVLKPVEPHPSPTVVFPSSYWIMVQGHLNREVDRAKRFGSIWAQWADKQGVRVEQAIDLVDGRVWEDIVEAGRRFQPGLVIMECQRTPNRGGQIGGVVRQVVRHAEWPVWILRTRVSDRLEVPPPMRERFDRAA